MPNLKQTVVALISMAAGAISHCWAQATPTLPAPSGKHPVGHASFHWVDQKRPEIASESADHVRELLVQIWYPAAAKPSSNPAPYLHGAKNLASSGARDSLSNLFGPSWPSITANELRTHSFEKAPVVGGAKLPILIFSPGGGVPVAAYTTQMEDLASHRYVVIGIDHPHEGPGVVFPDGRVVTAAQDFLNRVRQQSADTEGFEKKLTDLRAADIRFVVDKLQDLQTSSSSILHARLDVARLGIFGHSRGGRSAARACQLDARIKACLSQDGNMGWQPFWLDQSGHSLNQPFMMLDHFDPDPPDEMFKKMGTTRDQYVGRRSARQAEAREKLYQTIAGGSYHVTIKTPGVSHNSFADIRQLGRPDGSGINAWPEDARAATPNALILTTITAWTRAFFDKTLRGVPGPLAGHVPSSATDVEIRLYGANAK